MKQTMATYYPNLSNERGNMQDPCPGEQKLSSYSKVHSDASADGSYLELLSGSSMSSFVCTEFASIGARNELAFILPTSDAMNLQSINGQLSKKGDNLVDNYPNGDSPLVSRTLQCSPDGQHNLQRQGLSLSLGTQVQSAGAVTSFQYQYPSHELHSLPSTNDSMLGRQALSFDASGHNLGKEMRNSEFMCNFEGSNQNRPTKAEPSQNPQYLVNLKDTHMAGYLHEPSANCFQSNKYIKAAQQLLDELVSVKEALIQLASNKCLGDSKETDEGSSSHSLHPAPSGVSSDPSESISKPSSELSSVELRDLQNKKTKLLSMLDEVDRKYKEYRHQMQILVSSFDMVAGHGAAKPYTALALLTISRHFRCLRDAIGGQIEATRKRLGEQDTSSNIQGAIPRLRYVDRQVRQQRALQHLGVTRHSWRPQRGLPESAVSVLRAWLFEHFLNPYPNESEKIVLARLAGLTRSQVANWFINARVRLWKPMVEDIYKEEFAESETNSKSSQDDATKAHGKNQSPSKNRAEELQDHLASTRADSTHPGEVHEFNSSHVPISEMKQPMMTKTQFVNSSQEENFTSSGITNFQHEQRPSCYPDETGACDQNGDGGLMSASVAHDMSMCGFGVGNEVSLGLGLQHHENDAFSMFL